MTQINLNGGKGRKIRKINTRTRTRNLRDQLQQSEQQRHQLLGQLGGCLH